LLYSFCSCSLLWKWPWSDDIKCWFFQYLAEIDTSESVFHLAV
jgi:hypothetical protein